MIEQIAASFSAGLRSGNSVDSALDEYLAATQSRAVGLWRLVGDELHQVGFRAHSTMPADVAQAFAAATRVVNLEQTGLGCVQAAVSRQPTVARLEADGGTLMGSAGWLERFGAVQSLAVPLIRPSRDATTVSTMESGGLCPPLAGIEEVRGVLALSTAYPFGPEHAAWKFTEELGLQIAEVV